MSRHKAQINKKLKLFLLEMFVPLPAHKNILLMASTVAQIAHSNTNTKTQLN